MSVLEPTSKPVDPEGLSGTDRPSPKAARWKQWTHRARRDIGLSMVRGAATAFGGAIVSFGVWWLKQRY
ncbi:hypothetical protein PUR61_28825 [Streptomyces sp. BE20]|uniref:hypothetical protein n=1 Tax=Streptomyces sp. BE20 TaxID=3002525 RepID=UPI002E75B8F4|nr:hypothetical protein [Streptomyces sp. BE20]MEE1826164.1 hypothetical protein [Streptomyces sp. BE20]